MNFNTLSKEQKQYLMLGGLAAVILFTLLVLGIRFSLSSINDAKTELALLTEKIESADQTLSRRQQVSTDFHRTMEELRERVIGIPPARNYYSWATEVIYSQARQAGLEIDSIDEIGGVQAAAQSEDDTPYRLESYALRLNAHGGFNNVKVFIQDMKRDYPLVRFTGLDIASGQKPDVHDVQLWLQWPFNLNVLAENWESVEAKQRALALEESKEPAEQSGDSVNAEPTSAPVKSEPPQIVKPAAPPSPQPETAKVVQTEQGTKTAPHPPAPRVESKSEPAPAPPPIEPESNLQAVQNELESVSPVESGSTSAAMPLPPEQEEQLVSEPQSVPSASDATKSEELESMAIEPEMPLVAAQPSTAAEAGIDIADDPASSVAVDAEDMVAETEKPLKVDSESTPSEQDAEELSGLDDQILDDSDPLPADQESISVLDDTVAGEPVVEQEGLVSESDTESEDIQTGPLVIQPAEPEQPAVEFDSLMETMLASESDEASAESDPDDAGAGEPVVGQEGFVLESESEDIQYGPVMIQPAEPEQPAVELDSLMAAMQASESDEAGAVNPVTEDSETNMDGSQASDAGDPDEISALLSSLKTDSGIDTNDMPAEVYLLSTNVSDRVDAIEADGSGRTNQASEIESSLSGVEGMYVSTEGSVHRLESILTDQSDQKSNESLDALLDSLIGGQP